MTQRAREIMRAFMSRTGLGSSGVAPKRYLWTDAFAVCNLLGFYAQDGDTESLEQALRLIHETHRVLGRHRADDSRTGWISGLDDDMGAEHPTAGGLRIGKEWPERGRGETYDASLEWERDGQYFHYLTKWIHALAGASRISRDTKYHSWAVELAETAFSRFAVFDASGSTIGLRWKMSIDLSRALVPSMGHHDPLDGLVTFSGLCDPSDKSATNQAQPLRREIGDLARLCEGRDWHTGDALGVGGLLSDAYSLAKLIEAGVLDETALFEDLIDASLRSVQALVRDGSLAGPASRRLPFREFGLTIGLRAAARLGMRLERLSGLAAISTECCKACGELAGNAELASSIENFWQEPENQQVSTWTEHRDINEVMLATSLAPCGFLNE